MNYPSRCHWFLGLRYTCIAPVFDHSHVGSEQRCIVMFLTKKSWVRQQWVAISKCTDLTLTLKNMETEKTAEISRKGFCLKCICLIKTSRRAKDYPAIGIPSFKGNSAVKDRVFVFAGSADLQWQQRMRLGAPAKRRRSL